MSHVVDIAGKRFGKLRVLCRDGSINGRAAWLCECDCKTRVTVIGKNLRLGTTQSCGCTHGTPGGFLDLTDRRFGRLRVLEFAYTADRRNFWKCECDCTAITYVPAGLLTSGKTQSCGCLKADLLSERATTHGMRGTRLYSVWCNMKTRCTNPNSDNSDYYYFLGITYVPEWDHFEPFMEWAQANGYRDNLSLDRISPYKDYCPENCRWIPLELQPCNTTVQYREHFRQASSDALSYVDSGLLPEQVSLFVQSQYDEKYWAQHLRQMSFDLLDTQSTEALDYFLTEMYKALFRIYTVAFVDIQLEQGLPVDDPMLSFQEHCLRELELQQQVFDQQSWPLPVVYHDAFEASMKRE